MAGYRIGEKGIEQIKQMYNVFAQTPTGQNLGIDQGIPQDSYAFLVKITGVASSSASVTGAYTGIESLMINSGQRNDVDATVATVWDDNTLDATKAGYLHEVNAVVDEGLIGKHFWAIPVGTSEGDIMWIFDSGSAGFNPDLVEVDKSVVWDWKETQVTDDDGNVIEVVRVPVIQFRNDIKFNDVDFYDGTFDANNNPNLRQPPNLTQVGSSSWGNALYGGMEQTSGESEDQVLGVQRAYKPLYHPDLPKESYLMPQTDHCIENDADSTNLINSLWIKFVHRFGGKVMEIYHSAIGSSQIADDNYRFPHNNQDTTPLKGVVYVYDKSDMTNSIALTFDNNGHCVKMGSDEITTCTPPTDYNGGGYPTLAALAYPSSGSLYNYAMTQNTDIKDSAGANTDTYNAANNVLRYYGYTATGKEYDIGFTKSNGNPKNAGADDGDGAGTGGNDSPIYMDMSKILDGSEIILDVTLIETGNSTNQSITADEVFLESSFEGAAPPVPDDLSFTVRTQLKNACDGTGARYTRFDGAATLEYRLVTFLFFKGQKAAFDPSDNTTYLETANADVDAFNGDTMSGADISLTHDFTAAEAGAEIIARTYLEFYQTADGALPHQIGNIVNGDNDGICCICNTGNYVEVEDVVAGTAATHTVTTDKTEYNLQPDENPATDENDSDGDYVDLTNVPIQIQYEILQGGNTTNFSNDGKDIKIELLKSTANGLEPVNCLFSTQVIRGTSTEELIQANGNIDADTDGLVLTITQIEGTLEELDGKQYTVRITQETIGVITTVFEFDSTVAVLPSDQIHYYDFEGTYTTAAGTAWDDKIGTSHLTVTSADFSANAASGAGGRSGQQLLVPSFSAGNNFHSTAGFATGLTQPFTITGWLYFNNLGGSQHAILSHLSWTGTNTLSYSGSTWTETITTGKWYFYAIVGDSGNTNLYWGDSTTSPTLNATTISSSAVPTGICSGGSSSTNFKGYQDDIRVWGKALSGSQITDVWNNDK